MQQAAARAAPTPTTARAAYADPTAELLAGWLHKQDHQQFSRQFKRRYFVLRPGCLEYFRNESKGELLKTVAIGDVLEVTPAFERKLSKLEGELHLKTKERTFKLLAETHEEMRRWMKGIKRARERAANAGGGGGGGAGGGAGGAAGGGGAAAADVEGRRSSRVVDGASRRRQR